MKKYPHNQESKQIEAMFKLLQFDEATTEEERLQILSDIHFRYIQTQYEHYKPEDFMNRGGSSIGSMSHSEAEDDEDNSSLQIEHQPVFGEQKKTSELDYDKYFSKAKLSEKFKGDPTNEHISDNALAQLPPGVEHDLDFTQYHPKSVYQRFACPANNGKRVTDLTNQSFYDSLKLFFEQEYNVNKLFVLNQDFCDRLTLSQLDKLATLHQKLREDSVFIGSYFQKQFSEELSAENQEIWSSEEKRANLLTLYQFAKSKSMPKTLQAALLIEVLDIGIKVGNYSEELFRDYLKMPLVSEYTQYFKHAPAQPRVPEKKAVDAVHWNRYISNVQQSQKPAGQVQSSSPSWDNTQSEMIRKYLEYFCSKKENGLEDFKDDFEKSYLRSIEERVAIYSAEAAEGLTKLKFEEGSDILKKYQAISSETIVRFLESNPEQFKVEEEVTLTLELKNVQTLYLKIFEFNTETYYKKTLQPFNTGVNLDGLVASTERVVEDFKDRPSNKKFVETFKFPELTNKVGLFIVEFIGNGLSARAVIKKGSLSLIHKPTIAGHLAYVLDENKKICIGDEGEGRTGVYFDGQYFPAKPDKGGKIFIPYGKSSTVSKAILLHNGFAQLCDFERQTESYSFNAWIHLNSESILIGNKASILIKPQLLINNRPASLDLLKNVKVTLTTTNFTDQMPNTKTFDQIKLRDSQDCVLDFQVPPYLQDISVNLECEVFNLTQQSNQKFTADRSFSITTSSSNFNMCELYMRKEGKDYNVYVLGKNGEPRSEINLQVGLMHKWNASRSQPNEIVLSTDKDGKVKLGQLKKIIAVSVRASHLGLSQNWLIGNSGSENMLTYPKQIDLIEGEHLEFPVCGMSKKSRKAVSLIKLWSPQGSTQVGLQSSGQIVLEDLYEKIELIPTTEERQYSIVKIESLQEGSYKLRLKKLGKTIIITVHRGQYWDNDSFILKRNCLFENRAPLKMIKVSNVQVSDQDQAKQTIKVQLEDNSPSARLHVFATHFLPTCPMQMFASLSNLMIQNQTKTIFPFAQWKNILLSNRELSDEFRYVFDRKYAERYLGNTLDRPKLLLKRNFIQNTQVSEEVLNQGQQYQQQQVQQEVQRMPVRSQAIAGRAYDQRHMMLNSIQQQSYSGKAYNSYDDYQNEEFGMDQIIDRIAEGSSEMNQIPGMQNFLKHSPVTLFNLVPNPQSGEVSFQINLKPYTQLFVLAVDLNSVAQKQLDLSELSPTQKRDLSLAKPLSSGPDDNKGFTESRTTISLNKDDTHSIEDITSTEIQLIDDMKKVKSVLEELMKQNYTTSSIFKDLNGVIMKWTKMENEEKNKLFYKNFCHELNFFIKNKDPDYFQKTVKPFIECKMEKSFVDLYLLEKYDPLIKTYNNLERLNQLNAFEMCLLVDALVSSGKQIEAQRLGDFIRAKKESLDSNNVEQNNKIFDMVLNLNMLKSGNQPLSAPPGAPSAELNDLFGNFNNNSNIPTASLSINANNNNPFQPLASLQQAYMPPPQQFHQYQQQPQMMGGFGGSAYPQGAGLFGSAMPTSTITSNIQYQNIQPAAYSPFAPPQYQQQQMIQPRAYNESLFDDLSYSNMDMYSASTIKPKLDIMHEYNEQKKKVRMAFEEIQTTGEYMETHYYKQFNYSQFQQLIPMNSFWNDYAQYLLQKNEIGGKQHFLSANFTANSSNPQSAIITFALMDLPMEDAKSHEYKASEVGRGMEIKASGNVILFKKEVKEAPLDITNDILVTHRYVSVHGGSSSESSQAIPDEFLVNKAYSCEVIMTNVSPQQKNFSVLYQIPQGSLPLQMTKYMKSAQQSLAPYTTNKMIFHFYFPKEGDFIHYPSNVSSEEKIIARGNQSGALPLKVVKKLSVTKKETFIDIMQSSTRQEDVLEFLKTKNLLKGEKGFSFYLMLWMLRDKPFFKSVIEVLRNRLIYDDMVWSYSFYHKDDESICREYLMNSKPHRLISLLGTAFNSKLLTITLEDSQFKHLDYFPLVNARAHLVGALEPWTLNRNFRDTYNAFLRAMVYYSSAMRQEKPMGDPMHRLMLVQYMQLQDRVTEAIGVFNTVKQEELADNIVKIQHDYMSAYFDFFTGQEEGFKVARSIVRKYEDYPIPAWRLPFLEILDQLNEYDGELNDEADAELLKGADPENLTDEQKKLKYKQSVKREPRLTCDLQDGSGELQIEAANLKQSISVKFYIIDAEILFSRTPFLKANTEEFSYVKPCHKLDLPLSSENEEEQKLTVKIPDHLLMQNMVIEVTGEGKQLFKTYYATQIKVQLTEAYGELKVTEKDSNKPLPKVYVKVFSQKSDGTSQFFKDGYTDIRGKFDYAQTSGNRLKDVKRFAILVMSDSLGSIIKECDPPKFTSSSSSSESTAEEGGIMAQNKAERLMNRIQYKSKCLKK